MVLRCIFWNINGISDKLTIPSVIEFLQKFHIVMLCETWLHENDCDNVVLNGYNSFHTVRKSLHYRAKRGSGGITIFVHNRLEVKIVSEKCDHFVVLELDNAESKLYMIVCYVPPKSTTFQCKTCSGDYFGSLSALIQYYSQLGSVIVNGDMNARTGILPDFAPHLGTICTHPNICDCEIEWVPPARCSKDTVVNEYGRDMLEICRSCNLVIVNGRSKSDKEGNFTRVGSTGRSVVDYVLAGKTTFDRISEFTVDGGAVESDHRPLCYNLTTNNSLFRNKVNGVSNERQERREYYVWENARSEEVTQ